MINIFDMDGVIVDSLSAHIEFYQEVARKHKSPQVTREKIKSGIKLPSEDFYQNIGFPESLISVVRAEYNTDFQRYSCPVFPEVIKIIQNLRKQKQVVCLATLNRRKNVERLLGDNLNLFDEVITRDEADPKSVGLKMIVDRFRLPANQYRLIGDTIWDLKDARDAEIGFLGVSWGWHNLQPNSEYAVVQTPRELQDILLS